MCWLSPEANPCARCSARSAHAHCAATLGQTHVCAAGPLSLAPLASLWVAHLPPLTLRSRSAPLSLSRLQASRHAGAHTRTQHNDTLSSATHRTRSSPVRALRTHARTAHAQRYALFSDSQNEIEPRGRASHTRTHSTTTLPPQRLTERDQAPCTRFAHTRAHSTTTRSLQQLTERDRAPCTRFAHTLRARASHTRAHSTTTRPLQQLTVQVVRRAPSVPSATRAPTQAARPSSC